MNYIPGQRWVSEAEPELGLGTVLRCDERALQVLFAKSGVVRNYAAHGAPLARASFRVGQRIAGRGISFVVERIDLQDGLLVYSGEKRELVEGQLDD
ncbi:MAG: RNA polymerase-associated protein RapA, partial [Rhodanobacteraceae bacterium]